MPQAAVCPDLTQYQQLAASQLADADEEALLEHLESCESCAQKLNTLAEPDTLVELIRREQAHSERAADGVIGRLVERLSKLCPGEPPAAAGNASPEPGSRLAASTVDGVKVLSGITVSIADEPRPTGANSKELCDFLAPPQAPDELGRLGPFRVLQVLGAGGMGVVFRAEDPQLARLVALKAMLPALAASGSARQRFVREARAAAAIKHDHIVTIHQVGEDRGVPFLAMDFLEGEPLDVRLKREGKLPVPEVLRIGREIALGLAAAHKRQLIHRDIKPANIWLEAETGRVKILDFGLARAAGAEAQITQQGAILGTPAYMAPEQGQGKGVDPRCDLFSLGCVLYRMTTGALPFQGTDVISTLMAVSTHHPSPPHEVDPGLPQGLSAFIMSLLAKEAGKRPPSAQAVADALERHARAAVPRPAPGDVQLAASSASAAANPPGRQDAAVAAKPVPVPGPLLKKARRDQPATGKRAKKWWGAACAGIALLAVLIGLWAGGVIRVRTPDGVLLIDVNEPRPEVFVDGKRVTVTWDNGGKKAEIRIKPGTRKVEVKKDGFTVYGEEVEVKDGERRVFTARLDRPQPARPLKGADGPADRVTLEQLRQRIETAWPGLGNRLSRDGAGKYTLYLRGCPQVTDLKPLKGMPLTTLNVTYNGALSDLSPLQGMRLKSLWIGRCPKIKDLRPLQGMELDFLDLAQCNGLNLRQLKGMKIKLLSLWNSATNKTRFIRDMQVTALILSYSDVDLAPLKGMPLTELVIDHCGGFSDLTALKGLPLTRLNIQGCDQIKDVTPLKDLPLQEILCDFKPERDAKTLRAIKTLKTINGTPVAEFWKGQGASPEQAAPTKLAPPPAPSAALAALRRDQIPPEALKMAGDGDLKRAPAGLVGVLGEAGPLHTDTVRGLAFSADGRWLASASYDKTILLRDVVTGRVQRVMKGHTSWVMAVAFSRDSQTLVSAGHDGTLKLWPLDRAEGPQTLQPKLGAIWGMAVSAEGGFLAAGGTSGGVRLWKWGQWDKPLDVVPAKGNGWIHFNGNCSASLAFSSDGELLAVAQREDNIEAPIHLYRTSDGKLARTLPGRRGKERYPLNMTFSRDGKYLAGFLGGDKARVWDVASGKSVAEFPAWQFGCAAFSPDGKTLFVGGMGRGDIYDLASQTALRSLSAGHHWCFSGAFSSDGKLFAAGFTTGLVHVWDTATWKEKYLDRGHLQHVRALAISPDGSKVLSAGNDDTLHQWDLARPGTNRIVHQFAAEDFYTGNTPSSSASLAFDPTGKRFALLVRGNGYLRLHDGSAMIAWEAAPLKKRWTVPLWLDSIAFSPDGKAVAGACRDGTVRLWDAALGTELHRFGSLGTSSGLAFSKDGKRVAVASQDKEGRIKIWDVASGAEVHSWKDTSMTAAVFRPDGQVLATGHQDGTIGIWDLAEGKKKRTLKGHLAQLQSLKFTPDGKTLVTSGYDGTIRVWNPDRERAQQVIPLGPANRRLVMDLDPSGRYLVAAGHGPVIYVLRLPRDGNKASP